ncbi:MAG: hypothetical protein MJZ81_06185 [Bacteroidales bacterium]|nr:hypothetical protein [Bacteroidales bacterium]
MMNTVIDTIRLITAPVTHHDTVRVSASANTVRDIIRVIKRFEASDSVEAQRFNMLLASEGSVLISTEDGKLINLYRNGRQH